MRAFARADEEEGEEPHPETRHVAVLALGALEKSDPFRAKLAEVTEERPSARGGA
jgi:hypothetical protein